MGNSHEYARKHLASRVVVSGDTVEFYEYKNPIYIDFERQHDVVKENSEGEKGKREDNLYRARKNVRQIIWCNLTPHTKFLTLTYSETMLDMKKFKRDFQTFCQSMKRQGYPLRYLYVLERQIKRGMKEGNEGTIHAHLVVFNDEKIPLKVIQKAWPHGRTEIHILKGLRWDRDGNGYRKGDKVRDVGAYVCKYITKEAALEWGSKTYKCSLNLKRPIEEKFYAYDIGTPERPDFVQSPDDAYDSFLSCVDVTYEAEKEIRYTMPNGEVVVNRVYYKQGKVRYD